MSFFFFLDPNDDERETFRFETVCFYSKPNNTNNTLTQKKFRFSLFARHNFWLLLMWTGLRFQDVYDAQNGLWLDILLQLRCDPIHFTWPAVFAALSCPSHRLDLGFTLTSVTMDCHFLAAAFIRVLAYVQLEFGESVASNPVRLLYTTVRYFLKWMKLPTYIPKTW